MSHDPTKKPSGTPNARLGAADFAALNAKLDVILETLAKPATLPLTLSQPEAMAFTGLSKSAWHRLKSAGLLPRPVHLPGAGDRYRTRDLQDWVAKQKPKRK